MTIFGLRILVHVTAIFWMGFMALLWSQFVPMIPYRCGPLELIWIRCQFQLVHQNLQLLYDSQLVSNGPRHNLDVVGAIRIGESLIQRLMCSQLLNTNKTHDPNVLLVVETLQYQTNGQYMIVGQLCFIGGQSLSTICFMDNCIV